MIQFRIGIFFGGATLAGAFSGLLAFGISFMAGTAGLLGWSWIFVRLALLPYRRLQALTNLTDHRGPANSRRRGYLVLQYVLFHIRYCR